MADLITCPACSREVSKSAEKCPHCGHPIKPKESSGCLIAIGVGLCVIGLFWWPAFIIAILIFIWAAVAPGPMMKAALKQLVLNRVVIVQVLKEVVAIQEQLKEGNADHDKVEHRLFEIRKKLADEANSIYADIMATVASESKDFPGL